GLAQRLGELGVLLRQLAVVLIQLVGQAAQRLQVLPGLLSVLGGLCCGPGQPGLPGAVAVGAHLPVGLVVQLGRTPGHGRLLEQSEEGTAAIQPPASRSSRPVPLLLLHTRLLSRVSYAVQRPMRTVATSASAKIFSARAVWRYSSAQ